MHYGFHVVFGSRNPNISYLKQCLGRDSELEADSIQNAWLRSDRIVFIAVNAESSVYERLVDEIFKDIGLTSAHRAKIAIDISNKQLSNSKTSSNADISNAELLQQLFDRKIDSLVSANAGVDLKSEIHRVSVVKGFNLVNPYVMSLGCGENKGSNEAISIELAGDDESAKECIAKFSHKIGFKTNDVGPLKSSLRLETLNLLTFDDWQYPSLFCIGFFLFNFTWILANHYFFSQRPYKLSEFLYDLSLTKLLTRVSGFTALHLLAIVYLASLFASLYQLYYDSKYRLFPKYLDFWLKSRKQLGLWAFLIASFHIILTIYTTSPAYVTPWYRDLNKPNKFNLTRMTLNGEMNILTGVLTYLLMSLVALSSINSIALSFNWSEWRFVQTKIGVACLAMGLCHVISMYTRLLLERQKYNYTPSFLLTRGIFYALFLPNIVLIGRFIFGYFPPIKNRIERIRKGKSDDCIKVV
jgi:predicted dinucleotide-binding enzyme/DMSO/TMAO reductase YedYZ heme-binding membrane subunit